MPTTSSSSVGKAEASLHGDNRLDGAAGIRVDTEKTRLCKVPEESFDFLDTASGDALDQARTGIYRYTTRHEKIPGMIQRISQKTQRGTLCCKAAEKVEELNALLQGSGQLLLPWTCDKVYRAVDAHCCYRLRQWLCRKHRLRGAGTGRYPDEYLARARFESPQSGGKALGCRGILKLWPKPSAVGSHNDAHPAPKAPPDGATEFLERLHRAAAGIALGVSQSRQERDIATKAVEWQITVAAVVTVEESSFLVAMQRVVGGVKIQDNLPALSRDRLNSFFD